MMFHPLSIGYLFPLHLLEFQVWIGLDNENSFPRLISLYYTQHTRVGSPHLLLPPPFAFILLRLAFPRTSATQTVFFPLSRRRKYRREEAANNIEERESFATCEEARKIKEKETSSANVKWISRVFSYFVKFDIHDDFSTVRSHCLASIWARLKYLSIRRAASSAQISRTHSIHRKWEEISSNGGRRRDNLTN